MAANYRQPKFYWFFSFSILVASVFVSLTGSAGDIDPSGYRLFSGDKFFILADTSFSSRDIAKVRFESAGTESTLRPYNGVDIRVYRVPKPMEFLKGQKEYRRPSVKGKFTGEGLNNALNYIWDSWYKKSRLVWQKVLSYGARKSTVASIPELSQTPAHTYQTTFAANSQWGPTKGFEFIQGFRYPLWETKPIANNKDSSLAGSSSGFIAEKKGNIYIPIGKRAPGLYLVEAIVGEWRANCLVFVSDTLNVAKVSKQQLFIWSGSKETGKPITGTKFSITDGLGNLDSGVSDQDGVFISKKESPEHLFVLAEDAKGGVSIAESFYYDSEAYQAKVFIFTDRPLYRPGDLVQIKVLGRDLTLNAGKEINSSMKAGRATITVIDSAGGVIGTGAFNFSGDTGGDTSFKLPEGAIGGGYTLRVRLNGEDYGAAFRVANFSKPHFEMQAKMSKANYELNEPIKGTIQLLYPNGKPVKGARLFLGLKSERLSMNEGLAVYGSQFPVELQEQSYVSSETGVVTFELPAAKDPSRYILNMRALDGAAFRVTSYKEILIRGYTDNFTISTDKNYGSIGEKIQFSFQRESGLSEKGTGEPVSYEAIRLQDQTKATGPLNKKINFEIEFKNAGAYTVRLLDAAQVVLGSRSYFVEGPGFKSPAGQIHMLSEKTEYAIGEVATVLLTFPQKVGDALITIERNQVSESSTLMKPKPWLKMVILSDTQWQVKFKVVEAWAPNIILSVGAIMRGEYQFQNLGLLVKRPKIDISFTPNKMSYLPGEKVEVDIATTADGKPVASQLTVSVVDEMIYVLQPEVAPDILDFFFHRRRNQVRTSTSTDFYSFDAAVSATNSHPRSQSNYSERPMKVQERARRDNVDTALWLPSLKTDAQGKAKFSFVMPSSLTRWRMTARAVASSGAVGQSKGYLLSNQDFYLKWSGPTRFRKGDEVRGVILAFNNSDKEQKVVLNVTGLNKKVNENLTLKPGLSPAVIPVNLKESTNAIASLNVDGKNTDRLEIPFNIIPVEFQNRQVKVVSLDKEQGLNLPPSAKNIDLKLMAKGSDHILKVVDDLLEYPYGCVEQTSSRLIPLAMAIDALRTVSNDEEIQRLNRRMVTERFRLIKMAGENAKFTWWGDFASESAFLTTYAYYADWRASKVMGLKLSKEHFENLLEIFSKGSGQEPIHLQVLSVWLMQLMGIPTKTLSEGVIDSLEKVLMAGTPKSQPPSPNDSLILEDEVRSLWIASLLSGQLAKANAITLPQRLKAMVNDMVSTAVGNEYPLLVALKELNKDKKDLSIVDKVYEHIRFDQATIDRSLVLIALESISGGIKPPTKVNYALGDQWKSTKNGLVKQYEFLGKMLPTKILSLPGYSAEIRYDGPPTNEKTLPISIERRLFKLVDMQRDESGQSTHFNVELVKPGDTLSTGALYVDAVHIVPQSKGNLIYGLLQVPLPPGADVEGTTWGIEIEGMPAGMKFDPEDQKSVPNEMGYNVPVPVLDKEKWFFNMIRFSQGGAFTLPKVQYFKMYQPNAMARENVQSFGQIKVN